MHVALVVWFAVIGLVGLVWLSRHLEINRTRRTERVLSCTTHEAPRQTTPRISVVVAAKDEADNITACVESLLKQDYPDFELIVVNDRSEDRTGDILRDLAEQHGQRLRVVTVTRLREGWFGKNNAMREGVAVATGEWLCFSDADCEQVSNRTLSIAMRECQSSGIGFLSILPVLVTRSLWERIIQPVCAGVMMLWFRPERVNDPRSSAAYANGAFMLMKRSVYDRIGGHEAVRAELNEDMRMARIAKENGCRLQVNRNDGLYTTWMYASLRDTWRGWSRIFYGCLETAGRLTVALLVLTVFSLGPWLSLAGAAIGACAGPTDAEAASWWQSLLAISVAVVLLEQSVMARFYRLAGMPAIYSLGYPIGATIVWGMLANAMFKLGGTTATTWRGRTYRAGRLEPDRAASVPTGSTGGPEQRFERGSCVEDGV